MGDRVGAILAPPRHLALDKRRGRLAQLVERLLYTQDVGGSIPSPPTSLRKRSAAKAAAPKPAWAKAGRVRLLRLGKPASEAQRRLPRSTDESDRGSAL